MALVQSDYSMLSRLMGRADLLCPGNSHINLLGYGKRVVYLDAEVPHSAFDFSVAEQQLHSSQISCATVDQGCFSTA
jgi:hypothetical protein